MKDSGYLQTASPAICSPVSGQTQQQLPTGSALRVATIVNLSRLADGEDLTLAGAAERLAQINEIAGELYDMCRAQRAHR